jgi:hypothetical protein
LKGYDPKYTDKVKLVVEVIERGLSSRKEYTFTDINRYNNGTGEGYPAHRSLLSMGDSNLTLKAVGVVADGHGKGQQFLQCLLRVVKLDRNPAGLQPKARGQVPELLVDDARRGLDQKLRPFQPVFLQLRQDFSDLTATLPLVKAAVPFSQTAQMNDEGIPISQAADADAVGNTGRHNLLGAAAADAEQEFDRGPIHERTGEGLKLPDHIVDFAVPDGFCGHG